MDMNIPARGMLDPQKESPKKQDGFLGADVSPHHTHIPDSNARTGSRLAAHLDILLFCAYRFISACFSVNHGFLTCKARRLAVPA